ncbi:hypothetical protein [Winogradskyella sp. 3972H.M.0a.05]|uniref:hypothetical protein n=1 Tax=Winogradskyella sp. 3972H.M.0a.05 TaxID=2950277 RepID=UPI00339A737A
MKNAIKLFGCVALFFLMPTNVSAQQYSQKQCSGVSTMRNIEFNGSSDVEEIKVEVSDDTENMSLNVNGTIKSGYLTVEIYDPKGKKHGNFSIESQLKSSSKKKELVCGQMQKIIEDPMKGDWVVKLIPKDVSGEISICAMQN